MNVHFFSEVGKIPATWVADLCVCVCLSLTEKYVSLQAYSVGVKIHTKTMIDELDICTGSYSLGMQLHLYIMKLMKLCRND